MEQNIIQKLNVLKLSRSFDIPSEEIDCLLNILENDEEKSVLDFIEFFSDIEKIFKLGQLTELEKGFFFSKLLQHNFWVTTEKTDMFARPKSYTKEFNKKGVLDYEINPLYDSYLKKNTIFENQVSYIDLGKSYLDSIFFCDIDHPSKKTYFFINYCKKNGYSILPPVAFKKYPFLLSNITGNCEMVFFQEIGKCLNTSFHLDPKDIYIFEPLQQFLTKVLAIPKSLAKDFITSYLKDPSLSTYWPKVKKEIIDFIEFTFEHDTKDYQRYISYYHEIGEYLFKNSRTKEDYEQYGKLLKKEFPISLISSYFSYLKSLEPVVKEEPKKARRELKQELEDLTSKEKFNYEQYFKVLDLLKQLNYADSINENIFSQMNRVALQNESYFIYLYTKAKALNPDLGVLKEIDLVMDEIINCDNEEDFQVWKTYLDSLFQELLDYGATNYDYDLALIHKN